MNTGIAIATLGALLVTVPGAAQAVEKSATGASGGPAAAVRAGVDAATRGDPAAAVKAWEGPAAAGDADAQFNLGMAYKRGLGVTVDMTRAEDLFRKAAAQGHLDAADQYGLLLFQTGRRREALPWLESAAERGEPRAQYVLGTARYNGDFVSRDWVSAYAMMSRAAAQGLPQATSSLALMDQAIPLEQRQQGVALAGEMAKKADALHASQAAQAGLGAPRVGPTIAVTELPPSSASDEKPVAAKPAAGASYASVTPRVVGAHGANVKPALPKVAPKPVQPKVVETPVAPPVAPPAAAGAGRWRVQLGAFSQAANADAAWKRASARGELAGKARNNVSGGGVTRLQAGPFASEAAANAACAGLKGAGLVCVVVRP